MSNEHAQDNGRRQASTTGELHAPATGPDDAHGEEHVGHVTSIRLLVTVFVALLALTWITVAVTQIELGPFNVWVALLIAAVKGALVVLYFMHLRWDSPFNATVFIAALLFVAILTAAVIHDSREYRPMLEPPQRMPRRILGARR